MSAAQQIPLFSPDGTPAPVRRMEPAPDACRRKDRNNPRSNAANERVHPYKAVQRERIRLFIVAMERHGATIREIAEHMIHPTAVPERHCYPNEISGRFRPMVKDGIIFESGRQRDGSEIYVARAEWCNGSEPDRNQP